MFYVDHKSKLSSKNFDPELHATCDNLVTVNKCIDMSTYRYQRDPLLQFRHTIKLLFNYETRASPGTQTSSGISQPVTRHCHLQIFCVDVDSNDS